jgi:hypothetical protein
MFKKLIKGTLLSILIFFSISFLTVLFQINSPLNRIEGTYELKIGFPFEYYHEFMVDCLIPNSGWNTRNLILNCGLTWGITMLLIMSTNREK